MKIAILGAGFTGMTAAYYLAKKGHDVTLFEKEKVLGGLAVGFRQSNWDWYLERAYHHLLDSEDDILNFAKEVGFEEIFFKETQTSSLYEVGKNVILGSEATPESNNDSGQARMTKQILKQVQDDRNGRNIFRIFPLDSPQDFLRFPLLSFLEKIRAGAVLAFLKFSPFFSVYERYTAEEFLKKTQGKHAWEVLWRQLFRKKFGKYAENILASFIWARITKRAKKLGYIKGGFQTLINYVERKNNKLGVDIRKGFTINDLKRDKQTFIVQGRDVINHVSTDRFDVAVSTLPTPILTKISAKILPPSYLKRFFKLKHLHAVVLILETKQKILENTYWLNVCSPKVPIMIIAQHTNFVDKKHYGGNHIAYVGWYVEREDLLMKMTKEELLKYCLPHIKKLTNYELRITDYFKFIGPFAQPIYDKDFLKNKPEFTTPVKNFYIANLDMTYPYDRGTNYAIKLGKEVAGLI